VLMYETVKLTVCERGTDRKREWCQDFAGTYVCIYVCMMYVCAQLTDYRYHGGGGYGVDYGQRDL